MRKFTIIISTWLLLSIVLYHSAGFYAPMLIPILLIPFSILLFIPYDLNSVLRQYTLTLLWIIVFNVINLIGFGLYLSIYSFWNLWYLIDWMTLICIPNAFVLCTLCFLIPIQNISKGRKRIVWVSYTLIELIILKTILYFADSIVDQYFAPIFLCISIAINVIVMFVVRFK